MFFRKSKLIRELREEIQRLREIVLYLTGQNTQLQQGYQGMKEVAEKALEAAKEKHFPQAQFKLPPDFIYDEENNLVKLRSDYLADPDLFSVKHCPECNVSVRSDSWPQECPACHSVFGFEEGAG